MNIGGIIGGTIAAIIGAAAWAALAFFGGIEVAYLALGIGFIVGLGVSAGSKSGGFGAAIVAVVRAPGSAPAFTSRRATLTLPPSLAGPRSG